MIDTEDIRPWYARTVRPDLVEPPLPASVDWLMNRIPKDWAARWCEWPSKGGCACLGCANVTGGMQKAGFTKDDWLAWKLGLPPNV